MSKSIRMTQAEALQAYVRDYSEELFTGLFYGFKTAKLASVEEGVKGERILTNLTVADGLARRWAKTFDPKDDSVTFVPKILRTVLNKADFSFVPTEFESNYLGWLRKTGQDPMDFPFEAYIMMKLNEKLHQEMENAVWRGEAATTPAATDLLGATFDGFLKLVTSAVAGGLNPVTTGAITSTNAVDKFRLLWAGVSAPYKEAGTAFIVPMAIYDAYRIHYKNLYHSDAGTAPIADTTYESMIFELGGGNARIIPFPGMGDSQRVIVTPLENLVVGVDGAETLNWQTEQDHRSLDVFADFRLGAQFRTTEPGILVVNDMA